jgi:exosortase
MSVEQAYIRVDGARSPFAAKPSYFHMLLLTVAIYGYVIVQLMEDEWRRPDSGHGPIILILAFWLMYRSWNESRAGPAVRGGRLIGILSLSLIAAMGFTAGIVGQISPLAYASIIPFLCAGILLFQTNGAEPRLFLPVIFLLFSIPLPGFIVDPITLPMKQLVAAASEAVLHAANYPVARGGVILYVGPYELQVADACAGLRTLLTLEALALLYLNLVEYRSSIRNAGLALLAVPISLASNIARVILLCLITFYWGDEAGQGFLHQFAGMTVFLCALILLIATDAFLRSFASRHVTP